MGDQAQFSDDISALWGPGAAGPLEPAPMRIVEPLSLPVNGTNRGPTTTDEGAEQRLADLEPDIRLLLDRVVESLSTGYDAVGLEALRTEVQAELAGTRRDVLAQLDRRLADADARGHERVAERLGALEADLRQAIDAVAAAMDAHEYAPVGKHRARAVRQELERELAAQLAAVRAETDEAMEQRIAAVEARLGGRLDRVAAEMAAVAHRLAEAVPRSQLHATRAQMQAALDDLVTRARDELRHELASVTDRLAAMEEQLAHLADAQAKLPADRDQVTRLERRLTELVERLDAERAQTGNGQAPAGAEQTQAAGKPRADGLRAIWALPRSIRGS